ncbi:tetratricopeptide repeat protein, partial [Anaerolinea sp.]
MEMHAHETMHALLKGTLALSDQQSLANQLSLTWEEPGERMRWRLVVALVRQMLESLPPASLCEEVTLLEDAAEKLESADPLMAGALWMGVGLLFQSCAAFDPARNALERAVDLFPSAEARFSLGNLLRELGLFADARPLLEQALVEDRQNGTPRAVIRDLDGLTLLALEQGKLEEALPWAEQALALAQSAIPEKDALLATVWLNYGTVLRDMNRLVEAEQAHRRALALDERWRGAEHPATARDAVELSGTLLEMGRIHEARDLVERALSMDRACYGERHPAVGRDLAHLGEILRVRNALIEARQATQQALEIFADAFGKDHPLVGTMWNNLGHILHRMNRLDDALNAFQQAMVNLQKNFGTGDVRVGMVFGNMGAIMQMQGKWMAARLSLDHAVRVVEQALGREHPTVAALVHNLGEVLRQSGDLDGARLALERALTIDLKTLGESHPDIALRYASLARIDSARGD